MENKTDIKQLFFEFVRYLLVGGTAFLVDTGVLALFYDVLLPELGGFSLYIATAIGFIAGLIVNYILSLVFVFKSARGTQVGRSVGAFLIFAVIGIIGLGLTELGMYIGTEKLGLHYLLVKFVVTGIVLMWNYLGRKILIFK